MLLDWCCPIRFHKLRIEGRYRMQRLQGSRRWIIRLRLNSWCRYYEKLNQNISNKSVYRKQLHTEYSCQSGFNASSFWRKPWSKYQINRYWIRFESRKLYLYSSRPIMPSYRHTSHFNYCQHTSLWLGKCETSGSQPKDSTDSSTQQGIYLGSNGFRYTKYDISGMWKSASDWLSYLQAANSLTVIDNRLVT